MSVWFPQCDSGIISCHSVSRRHVNRSAVGKTESKPEFSGSLMGKKWTRRLPREIFLSKGRKLNRGRSSGAGFGSQTAPFQGLFSLGSKVVCTLHAVHICFITPSCFVFLPKDIGNKGHVKTGLLMRFVDKIPKHAPVSRNCVSDSLDSGKEDFFSDRCRFCFFFDPKQQGVASFSFTGSEESTSYRTGAASIKGIVYSMFGI